VAHGQLFSRDALLATLMAVSVLAALVYFDRRGHRCFLLISGLAAGLAFSTKAPAIVLFAFIPLVGLLSACAGRRSGRVAERRAARGWRMSRADGTGLLRDLVLWGVMAGLIYVAIWPALWGDPLGTLLRLERGVLGVGASPRRWGNFFLGHVYDGDDVAVLLWPIFYPLVTALRLSPVAFAGLLVLVGALVVRRAAPRPGGWRPDRRVVALGGYVALFTVVMTLSPKKLDRYLLPVFPVLDILAALGLWLALRRWLPGRLRWPAVALLGACQVALLASVEPYPLSFYNPVLGGATVARQTMIVGWGEGLDQVAAYLDQQPDARAIVAVSLYKDQIVPLYRGNGARLEDWTKGSHLVTYVNMEQRGLVPAPLRELVATTSPDFTVWINGIVYARVYRIPPEVLERPGSRTGPRPNAVPQP
jgi:4-amino-4-deoxy-L-arabinose transferase-like glycosyltransferase